MQKKWRESVKNRLHAGGGIEKEMRNGCVLEVGKEWLGEEENLRMMNSYVRGKIGNRLQKRFAFQNAVHHDPICADQVKCLSSYTKPPVTGSVE